MSQNIQTALEIAKRGGTIHMVCRNPKYADEAMHEIKEASKNDKVYIHILDMSGIYQQLSKD